METTRYCVTCKQPKPIEDFEFHSSAHTSRRNQCRECRTKVREGAVETRSQRKLREEMLQAFHGAAKQSSVPAFSEYIESMLGLMGGVQGFAEFHFDAMMQSFADNPGSKKTLDAFRDFSKLWQVADGEQKSLSELTGLETEELENRVVALATRILESRNLRVVSAEGEVAEVPHARVG